MPGALPPGRAGRLWIQGRLDVARRAADLLDRKERLLRAEEQRLGGLRSLTEAAWTAACRQAESWTARAVLVGERADLHRPGEPATAEIVWRNSMGLTYPSEAACRHPAPPAVRSANPALPFAVAANRQAVEAAVRHAAAQYAHAQVADELVATRRRRRAITERWIPDLEAALVRLVSRLEELEREEHVRIRWAQRHAVKDPGTGPALRSHP